MMDSSSSLSAASSIHIPSSPSSPHEYDDGADPGSITTNPETLRITPPLLLSLAVLCLVLTGYASWACSFVTHDASSSSMAVLSTNTTTPSTTTTTFQQQQQQYRISSSYGLWTLQDDTHTHQPQCHLWYVFFVGAQLDGWIKVAQSCSMTAQVIGLMIAVGLMQHCRQHGSRYRYGVGAVWAALVVASILTRQQFNSWTLFFGSTYLVLLWLVQPPPNLKHQHQHSTLDRRKTAQPQQHSSPTRTTTTTSTRTTATTILWPHRLSHAALTTGLLTALATLSMRQSSVCTCATMVLPMVQGQALEFGACDHHASADDGGAAAAAADSGGSSMLRSQCRMGRAGWVMVASGVGWTVLGVLLRIWSEQEQSRRERCCRDEREDRRKENDDASVRNDDEEEVIPRCKRWTSLQEHHEEQVEPPSKLTGGQRCRLYSYRFCLCNFLLVYFAMILLLVISHWQNNQAAKLPDTSPNFLTDTVCAFQPTTTAIRDDDDSTEFVTFPSKEQAILAGYQVAHCGACGYCSNPTDISTYINTRTTIADTAKTCGKYTVMGRLGWFSSYTSSSSTTASSSSSSSLYDCLEDRIGFTPECTQCWVDNMKTTARLCMMTCVSTVLNGFMGQNNMETVLGSTTVANNDASQSSSSSSSSHWMNQCFFCDEKQSGPAFVQCSGVARRRLGIASEIARDPREQCTAVDWDWTNVELKTLFGRSGTTQHGTSV